MHLFGLILYVFYITHCAVTDLLDKCSVFSHIVSKHFIYIMCMYVYKHTYLYTFKNYFPLKI